MIYLIGGAPRVGKSTLCQQMSARLGIGWISTDLLMEVLRLKNVEGLKTEWNASPEAITNAAEWFLPYLARFVWGVSSLADGYAIEGVDFLPAQVAQISRQFNVRSIFLGRSAMTLAIFDEYPCKSKGYAGLPMDTRYKFSQDIPLWSEFIRLEAERSNCPYIDMSNDFPARLLEAEKLLTIT